MIHWLAEYTCTAAERKEKKKGGGRRRFVPLLFLLCISFSIEGCGSQITLSFQDNAGYSNFNFMTSSSGAAEVAPAFASEICVAEGDVSVESIDGIADTTCAALFDLNGRQTLFAKDVFERVYPASLTKIMTALVALENAELDTVLTASSNVYMTDADAQRAGLEEGDTMTLDQALHLLLIHSDNDVAVMIAENIGGSTENFIQMMNEEAMSLGATKTNFINSNGLTDQNHYTSVYDMYLIFNEAMQFQSFQEIIAMSTYTTVYHDRSGANKEITVNSTNSYNMDYVKPPTGVTVIGGKTGTTTAAGHNLILYVRDSSGNPYIAVVMKALDNDACYQTMNDLLDLIE